MRHVNPQFTVRLDYNGTVINGHGKDVDTLVASALAYSSALCKVVSVRSRGTVVAISG